SGADVIGLANAGADTTNAITTASEFGVTQSGQTLAALLLFLTDVHALGAQTAQGIQLTTGWYWDMNDETREWSDRFMEETGVRPTMVHAGIYSSAMQYLKAVEATGSDDAQTVRKQMMDTPINDMFAKNGKIRVDGRMVHDMYLADVKTPAEESNRPLPETKSKVVNNKKRPLWVRPATGQGEPMKTEKNKAKKQSLCCFWS
ncbi:MAG: ABC transporter substrate-binding protein, partial [Pseudomonadota bacterium]|nr:ABC transporter substrate-binding protein [Pseudomonadota bacterium]